VQIYLTSRCSCRLVFANFDWDGHWVSFPLRSGEARIHLAEILASSRVTWRVAPTGSGPRGENARVDIDWAIKELDRFLELTELYRPPDPPGIVNWTARRSNRGSQDDIRAGAQVIEQVVDRVIPDWRTSVPADRNKSVNRWCQHMEAATRAKAQLLREEELAEKLGEDHVVQRPLPGGGLGGCTRRERFHADQGG